MKHNHLSVLTWNIGGFSYRKKQSEAWAYLEETLNPDIAFLQEVPRSKYEELRAAGQALAYRGETFGTMVYCRDELMEKVATNESMSHCSSAMYLSAVDIGAFPEPFTLVSAHVNPDTRHKANLKKLVEVLDQARHARQVIIGGDFNACRLYDVVHKKNACSWFFKAMDEIGFIDCHYRLHAVEERTYWSNRTAQPYQDDHFFASANLWPRIKHCGVLPYDPADGLSDHGPVELVIDLPE